MGDCDDSLYEALELIDQHLPRVLSSPASPPCQEQPNAPSARKRCPVQYKYWEGYLGKIKRLKEKM